MGLVKTGTKAAMVDRTDSAQKSGPVSYASKSASRITDAEHAEHARKAVKSMAKARAKRLGKGEVR